MDTRWIAAVTLIVIATVSCSSTTKLPQQSSLPSSQPQTASAASTPATPQISGSQRLQHAWAKAIEGLAMGGTIAGPYGAGGGLVIGLIAGLFMAESHYAAINTQIQVEQQKDRQLEAALEQELARQRELEQQIAGVNGTAAAATPDPSGAAPGTTNQGQTVAVRADSNAAPREVVASLNKPAAPAQLAPPFKNVEIRDLNGDNVPDVWLYYNPQKPGEIVRQEEASKNDGRVNIWSYFKDGVLVRRELDTRGQGRADAVFYYVNDKIAREERDETGEGRMTYRATYEGGRLAKVERETTGNGRTDLWIYYDTARDGEIVLREEKDLNGDGAVDLWSHYENGRVVRRDVNAAGLEILFKEEKSLATAEPRRLPPGS